MIKTTLPIAITLGAEKSDLGTFKFLTDCDGFALSAADFEALAAGQTLSKQDQGIFEEICQSLRETRQLPYNWSAQEAHYIANRPKEIWLEYIIYRFKFKLFPQRKILADFPVYLLIEPTSVCNLRCKMCFQVDKSFTKKEFMGTMDYAFFCKLIDEAVAGGSKALTMASRGEPTLNKDLGRMIKYASGKFLEIKLITNATKLTEKLAREILESDITLLTFSVDAHIKEVYEDIRVKGNFEEVRDNIKRFCEIRKKYYPDSKLITRISGVKVQDNQDPEGFAAFWSQIVDEVGMKPAFERWDTYANKPHPQFNSPCAYIWERLYIWYDGETNICDADYKTVLKPGNVKERSIREIWNGERLTQLRQDHLDGKRHSHIPCDRCGIK